MIVSLTWSVLELCISVKIAQIFQIYFMQISRSNVINFVELPVTRKDAAENFPEECLSEEEEEEAAEETHVEQPRFVSELCE